jgi:hypothetical protein
VGCLAVIGAVVLCIGATLFAADRYCIGVLAFRLPIYPGAEITSQRWNMFTPNGLGETVTVLRVAVSRRDVQSWYNRELGRIGREATNRADLELYYRISNATWSINPGETPDETQIILFGRCMTSGLARR